eukprot:g16418.t1
MIKKEFFAGGSAAPSKMNVPALNGGPLLEPTRRYSSSSAGTTAQPGIEHDDQQDAAVGVADVDPPTILCRDDDKETENVNETSNKRSKNLDLAALWERYLQRLERRPLWTKTITAAVCGVISEYISQYVILRKRDDLRGLVYGFVRQIVLSFVFRGPVMHYWTTFLNGKLFARHPQTFRTALLKVLVHETVYDPCFVISFLFLLKLSRLECSVKESWQHARREFTTALRTQYSVWPPIQLLNFALVPAKLQVGFITFVAVFTNAYLTYLSARG